MLCGSPRGCRVPSRWRSRFHEGAQAQGGLAGSHSLPVGSRSESKAPEPGKHRQVGRACNLGALMLTQRRIKYIQKEYVKGCPVSIKIHSPFRPWVI